ncbi:hypothetical protein D3C72_2473590 [compost metagenome]
MHTVIHRQQAAGARGVGVVAELGVGAEGEIAEGQHVIAFQTEDADQRARRFGLCDHQRACTFAVEGD